LKTENHWIGRLIRCAKCGEKVEVPRSQGDLIRSSWADLKEPTYLVTAPADYQALYTDFGEPFRQRKGVPLLIALCVVACFVAVVGFVIAAAIVRQREAQRAQAEKPPMPKQPPNRPSPDNWPVPPGKPEIPFPQPKGGGEREHAAGERLEEAEGRGRTNERASVRRELLLPLQKKSR
jgi:hypothetical protein